MTRNTAKPVFVDCTEQKRLNDAREQGIPWKKWGPYLSERQWGTVREDYSAGRRRLGLLHPRPGPLAGLPLGRGRPRPASRTTSSASASPSPSGTGATRSSRSACSASPTARATTARTSRSTTSTSTRTPTHSYMKYLYKYPQRAYPYRDLVRDQPRAGRRHELEYELLDTGVFDDDRYFDVFVEYAKDGARGHPDPDHRPQPRPGGGPAPRPAHALVPQHLVVGDGKRRPGRRCATVGGRDRRRPHPELGEYTLALRRRARAAVHRERDATAERLWGQPNADARSSRTASTTTSSTGDREAVNPARTGTKAAAHYRARRCPRAARDACACACAARRAGEPRRPFATSTRSSRPRRPRPTSSTTRITPRGARARTSGG